MESKRCEQRSFAEETRTIVLEARQISKRYGGEGTNGVVSPAPFVLEDITVQIASGEVIALLGLSGAGKSTLLRILAGMLTPTSGQVLFRGVPLHGPDPHLGLVSPSTALFPWLTVLEQVELALPAYEWTDLQRRKRALAAIEAINIDGFAQVAPRTLSEGMRQRIGLARALAAEPEVLLLDEPFGTCDPLTALRLRDELLRLWRGEKCSLCAIVLATHHIAEAVRLADRLLVLGTHPGRALVEVQGLPAEKRHLQDGEFRHLVHVLSGVLRKR